MSYKHFQNTKCEYFPCHKHVNDNQFNCLFCYCPLYTFDNCGGSYDILSNGWKDCSKCTIPHNKDMYDYIVNKLVELQQYKINRRAKHGE
jgi:Zn-finger protein